MLFAAKNQFWQIIYILKKLFLTNHNGTFSI